MSFGHAAGLSFEMTALAPETATDSPGVLPRPRRTT
jgi:hypothetical protein